MDTYNGFPEAGRAVGGISARGRGVGSRAKEKRAGVELRTKAIPEVVRDY
jgi:hypothetical protein